MPRQNFGFVGAFLFWLNDFDPGWAIAGLAFFGGNECVRINKSRAYIYTRVLTRVDWRTRK